MNQDNSSLFNTHKYSLVYEQGRWNLPKIGKLFVYTRPNEEGDYFRQYYCLGVNLMPAAVFDFTPYENYEVDTLWNDFTKNANIPLGNHIRFSDMVYPLYEIVVGQEKIYSQEEVERMAAVAINDYHLQFGCDYEKV